MNADDPQIAYLSKDTKAKSLYFGLSSINKESKTKHGADSIHCPNCSKRLMYKSIYFSHLGDWECPNCKIKRPNTDISEFSSYPLDGTYNKYNVLASALFATNESIRQDITQKSFTNFTPAFGRQEKIIYNGKNVQIFLSKNPTSFNESMQTVKELNGKNLLILLNDRIPDGLDVSWIWDINLEESIQDFDSVVVSGDRCYDMGLRIKYCDSSEFQISNFKFQIEPRIQKAIEIATANAAASEVLYILPNYSAMLDIRKILTGRKIL